MKPYLSLGALIYWAFFTIAPICAQGIITNMEIFQNLGSACLMTIPLKADSIMIDPPESLPYLTSHLIKQWQEQELVVFSHDTTRTSTTNVYLSWQMSNASVSYTRANRKDVSRSATLSMRYTLLDPLGEFIAHDICNQSFTDTIPKSIIPEVESELFPETQAEIPPDRWIRRYLQPIIIGAATALASFLFFNLRTNSADS